METEMPRVPWKHSHLIPSAVAALAFAPAWAQLLCREGLKGAMVGLALSLLVTAIILAIWLDKVADAFRQWALEHSQQYKRETEAIRQAMASLSMKQSELGDALGATASALGATKEELQSKLELASKEISTKVGQITSGATDSKLPELMIHAVGTILCTRLNGAMIDRTTRIALMTMIFMHLRGFLNRDTVTKWCTGMITMADQDLKELAEIMSVIPTDLKGQGTVMARQMLRQQEERLKALKHSIGAAVGLLPPSVGPATKS